MAVLRDRATIGAHAGYLDRVGADREPVPGGTVSEPGIEVAVAQLDDTVTVLTDEMMVVALAAQPVAGLAGPVTERVDDTLLVERGERPVDGCEPDLLALSDERGVDLLGSCIVAL
jgi:hypothetical protein